MSHPSHPPEQATETDFPISFPGLADGMTDHGHCPCDDLIAGEFPHVMRKVTITGGCVLARGAVLGRIHSDDCHHEDRYRFLSDNGAKDGSSMPDAILAQTVDARRGDKEAYIYLSGEFNASAVIIPYGQDADEVGHILRKRSIFLHR